MGDAPPGASHFFYPHPSSFPTAAFPPFPFSKKHLPHPSLPSSSPLGQGLEFQLRLINPNYTSNNIFLIFICFLFEHSSILIERESKDNRTTNEDRSYHVTIAYIWRNYYPEPCPSGEQALPKPTPRLHLPPFMCKEQKGLLRK